MKKLLLAVLLASSLLAAACQAAPNVPADTAEDTLTAHTTAGQSAAAAKALPAPDAINASNLIDFLDRDDVLYVDIRNYEEYVQGHFRNFELIPYAALVQSADAVENKSSVQLYGGYPEAPVPVYKESDAVLEMLFPKDKNLFIICRSGNRSGALTLLLLERGWDPAKVFNIGGMLDYETNPAYAGRIAKHPLYRGQAAYAIDGLERIVP